MIPVVPPRTYPPLPPSNLPNVIIGVIRIFSWLIGGSSALILIYHRFLLPLLIQSNLARTSLKSHHLALLRNLSASLSSLKESQAEAFAVLPAPQPIKEDPKYASCTSVDHVLQILPSPKDAVDAPEPDFQILPPISILRCAIRDLENEKPTTEDIFRFLESKIPWLTTPAATSYQEQLWQTLSTSPLFRESVDDSSWTYTPPTLPPPSPLLSSLTTLCETLSRSSPIRPSAPKNPRQDLLQSLTSLTGYITTHLYAIPSNLSFRAPGMISNNVFGPAEEELRREIRALKGLVLNRRSFMPVANPTETSA